ncbi:MGC86526 protein precursor [Xenopus laevis]|uniref:MGC86526 protein n=1 Tax=Xenopus laevis TaxID=8355 RepID=Q66IM8_XENLA|nr:C-reactive protein precursor [Xenopus laevis]AAH81284.1 MGC86526 protein [Xenopus laevis]
MEMRVLCLLLIAGSMAQEDMDRNVFFFSKKSDADYVVLTPMVAEPLNKLTVCSRSYTGGGTYTLLNVGTPELRISDMFVIYLTTSGYNQISPYFTTTIIANNSWVSMTAKADVLDWMHICMTWDSNTRVLQLWVNGKVYPRTVLQKGSSIDLHHSIVLGQKQRKTRASHTRNYVYQWDTGSLFQGEISDVHMWNEVLSPETIRKVLLNDREINGNVISWRSLNYTIIGDVIVQPKLQCRYGSESGSSYSQCSMD